MLTSWEVRTGYKYEKSRRKFVKTLSSCFEDEAFTITYATSGASRLNPRLFDRQDFGRPGDNKYKASIKFYAITGETPETVLAFYCYCVDKTKKRKLLLCYGCDA